MYCKIFYLLNGERKEWPIDAHPEKDNDETLKTHLNKWVPEAAYLGHQMGEQPNKSFNPTREGTGGLVWR